MKPVRSELPARLAQRVNGQRDALAQIGERIQTARAGLGDPRKPVGVFLLAGPSGVGKTETALALAEAIYGGEQNLITINMSEFQESHTVSTLKGAPPGYVGYGEGGVLTEAVRRHPRAWYCWMKLKKPITTSTSCSSRCLIKGRWKMAKVSTSISKIPRCC